MFEHSRLLDETFTWLKQITSKTNSHIAPSGSLKVYCDVETIIEKDKSEFTLETRGIWWESKRMLEALLADNFRFQSVDVSMFSDPKHFELIYFRSKSHVWSFAPQIFSSISYCLS